MKHSIAADIEQRRDWLAHLCSSIVSIPSVDRETDPTSNTKEVCQFIVGMLKEHGIESQVIEVLPGHQSLIAKIGKPGGKRVVYNGHLDTYGVQPNEKWTYDPFSGKIVDGRVYGRGATDMKGGDAALLTAFTTLKKFEKELEGEVVMTLFADEETGAYYGAVHILDNCPDALGDVVLSAEPTGVDNIRFGEKGSSRLTVVANGVSGHGGSPWRGKSATADLVAFLHKARTAMDGRDIEPPSGYRQIFENARSAIQKVYGERGPEFMTKITFNIGTLLGGVKDSIVADRSEAQLDVRSPVGFSHEQVMEDLSQHAKAHDVEIHVRHSRSPNFSDPDHPACQMLIQNAAEVTGTAPYPMYSLGGSDLRFYRRKGVPGFIYGPGSRNFAKADEYVEIEDMVTVAKVHAMTAYEFLKQ